MTALDQVLARRYAQIRTYNDYHELWVHVMVWPDEAISGDQGDVVHGGGHTLEQACARALEALGGDDAK